MQARQDSDADEDRQAAVSAVPQAAPESEAAPTLVAAVPVEARDSKQASVVANGAHAARDSDQAQARRDSPEQGKGLTAAAAAAPVKEHARPDSDAEDGELDETGPAAAAEAASPRSALLASAEQTTSCYLLQASAATHARLLACTCVHMLLHAWHGSLP